MQIVDCSFFPNLNVNESVTFLSFPFIPFLPSHFLSIPLFLFFLSSFFLLSFYFKPKSLKKA